MPKFYAISRWPTLALGLLVFILGLAACTSNNATPVVDRPQQRVTDAYLTLVAGTNAPPTAGPSPTPTITPTPFMTATQFPDADPASIIATVGSRKITLAEYQARVRYERWLPWYAIARRIPETGLRVLDLTRPENADTYSLLYTLNEDPQGLGRQVMSAMLTDQIVLREAGRLDLDLEQTIFDGRLAARINITLGANGARPDNWDEAYNKFIADLELHTGMSEQQFLEHIRALTYYEQLGEIIRLQAPLPSDDVANTVRVQDIIMDTRDDALEVKERLESGEQMAFIAQAYGKAPADGQTEREIKRSTEGLTEDILDAIFSADENDVIGPIATEAGWYVAKIENITLDFASPSDLEAVRREYFRTWIVEKMDNPDYTEVMDNDWNEFTPSDPLPKDVSPYLIDENFVLPDQGLEIDPNQPTPTPLPIGNSPR